MGGIPVWQDIWIFHSWLVIYCALQWALVAFLVHSGTQVEASGALTGAVWINQNLAGLAGLQSLHTMRKIFQGDAIRDHGPQIQLSPLEQRGHLVPGLVHAAAVDALNGDA